VTARRVFLSRAAALAGPQQELARAWSDALAELGLTVVTLSRDEYQAPPWSQLRSLVGSCHGVVVLGFSARPTAWSDVEAGLGIMGGLPVLVAAEAGMPGAVFGPEVWGGQVTGVSVRVWERAEPLAEAALQDWLSAVRSGSRSSR
jgi:hypothetical protein